MQADASMIGVIIVSGAALLLTALSIYYSHVIIPIKTNKAYRKSIAAIAAAVESRDPSASGQAKTVARFSCEVAQQLGVSNKEIERIEFAGLLMDIGKAQVPHAVLTKNEKLDTEEWRIVRNHCRIGAEMVAEVPFLADLSSIILYHHEYFNGEGYPFGLSGSDIPIASRILHVVGDYVAMVAERPYHKQKLAAYEAADEIIKQIGRKYDPQVAKVFLRFLGYTPNSIEIGYTDDETDAMVR
jgi:HD-GYP domain-containing protein (c-di-GMP phosphodiesterase class II)